MVKQKPGGMKQHSILVLLYNRKYVKIGGYLGGPLPSNIEALAAQY